MQTPEELEARWAMLRLPPGPLTPEQRASHMDDAIDAMLALNTTNVREALEQLFADHIRAAVLAARERAVSVCREHQKYVPYGSDAYNAFGVAAADILETAPPS